MKAPGSAAARCLARESADRELADSEVAPDKQTRWTIWRGRPVAVITVLFLVSCMFFLRYEKRGPHTLISFGSAVLDIDHSGFAGSGGKTIWTTSDDGIYVGDGDFSVGLRWRR